MTLAKRIIPCLDVDAGRVVKGVKFVEIRDAGDPVEVARRYDDHGAARRKLFNKGCRNQAVNVIRKIEQT